MGNKKEKTLKIVKGVLIVILSLILIVNVCIIIQAKSKPNSVPSIFGYKPFIVLSGSMESKIHVGDLVFVKKIEPSTLKIDDIIAFRDEENLVTTHRIISVVNTNKGVCFDTKGDNNNTKDEDAVCSDSIEGKYTGRIAKLGSILLFIQQPLGFIIMMMSLFIIALFIYTISNNRLDKKISEEEMKEFEEFKKARSSKKKK